MASTGQCLTYRALDQRSTALARHWRSRGLEPGATVAILAENIIEYPEIMWAAMRSGLQFTTISKLLNADEAGYILQDSDARALVTTTALQETATAALAHAPRCLDRLVIGTRSATFESYEDALANAAGDPLRDEPRGEFLLYSSGTTGRPKGVKRPLTGRSIDDPLNMPLIAPLVGMDKDAITVVPSPLYHSAPLVTVYAAGVTGGTLVLMERFDPEQLLTTIEHHRATHAMLVPTHFIRLLRVPEAQRTAHDLSSLRGVMHTAAPCPRHVKEAMIQWWGPVLYEYYGGTEGNGLTFCDAHEWLAHPGTVGRPVRGAIHICDDNGAELHAGHIGHVYFEMPERPFSYHNDPAETERVTHPLHPTWSTLGDIGYVDDDGFLYLTDRATFMIVSGGVNIYPQEIEDCLTAHPAVLDVAVVGIPDGDMGEQVLALVQPCEGHEPTSDLESELHRYTRDRLAGYKAPRRIEFVESLPRTPTGKLAKKELRDRYWSDHATQIV